MFPCPCSRLRSWSRDDGLFSRSVPRQPAHSSHTLRLIVICNLLFSSSFWLLHVVPRPAPSGIPVEISRLFPPCSHCTLTAVLIDARQTHTHIYSTYSLFYTCRCISPPDNVPTKESKTNRRELNGHLK